LLPGSNNVAGIQREQATLTRRVFAIISLFASDQVI
jgi:hypothetical protein